VTGAIVHDEARGEGVGYSASAASPPCPLDRRAPTESTDGTSVGTSSVGGCEAAGGVHLPLSRLVLRERPTGFRFFLRRGPARARLLRFRFGCAAQRSGTRHCSGRPRRRRAAAAPRRCWFGHCTLHSAAAWTCTADGGGDSAGALRRFAASENGAPAVGLGVHDGAGCDERSDDSAIAAGRRHVQRGAAILAVHGGAGGEGRARWGYPSPQPVPEHKTAGRPRGSTMCSFVLVFG
jgi:hypothetical protein